MTYSSRMEQQQGPTTRDEFWRLQSEMKNLTAVQSEHAERLTRLERFQEEDGRSNKSIWGGSSPFPGLGASTPSADTSYNPAAEAFRNFDQDQGSNMMGSLHLDAEEGPKRGTSRANSVRFDESALGHFGHASRSSTEFFPMRSNSAYGSSASLIERTASHRSDGRQSSTHSARLNSLGSETRAAAAAAAGSAAVATAGPPPGLFMLGPLPSIIRCWLDNNYSNETMLYAAICSGSFKSTLSSRLVQRLGRIDEVREEGGERRLKIPVYLPEATISESSSRSVSPAPSLPAITVDFYVTEASSDGVSIEILLGSDVLRFKNADVLFSQDRLSLLDDDRNRVAIPLVRPENSGIFKHLVTTASLATRPEASPSAGQIATTEPEVKPLPTSLTRNDNESNGIFSPVATSGHRPSVIGEGRRSVSIRDFDSTRSATADTESSSGTTAEPTARPDPTTLESWRRDASANKDTPATTSSFSSVASNSALRGNRGKSMKVLRPSRSGTSRSISLQSPGGMDLTPNTPKWPDAGASPAVGEVKNIGEVENIGADGRPVGTVKIRSNPIGSGSAFSWMNPSGTRTTAP